MGTAKLTLIENGIVMGAIAHDKTTLPKPDEGLVVAPNMAALICMAAYRADQLVKIRGSLW